MRNGRPILFVALGFLVAWVIQPVWQWYLGHALDALSGKNGVAHMIAILVPAHSILLGIALGMGLALTIGYWNQVRSAISEVWSRVYLATLSLLSFVLPKPSVLRRGIVSFRENETEKFIRIPRHILRQAAHIRFDSYSNVFAELPPPDGESIRVYRTRTDPQKIRFEIIGRRSKVLDPNPVEF